MPKTPREPREPRKPRNPKEPGEAGETSETVSVVVQSAAAALTAARETHLPEVTIDAGKSFAAHTRDIALLARYRTFLRALGHAGGTPNPALAAGLACELARDDEDARFYGA